MPPSPSLPPTLLASPLIHPRNGNQSVLAERDSIVKQTAEQLENGGLTGMMRHLDTMNQVLISKISAIARQIYCF